jgi:hypothetical protein
MEHMTRRIQTLDGLPVYDATEPLIIEIVKADIHPRDRKNPEKCALAQACKRELHVTEARAYLSRLYIKHGDHWLRYMLSESVRQEVASFDRGGGFSQGTYRIPAVPLHQRSGGKSQGGSGKKPGSTPAFKRQTYRKVEGVRAASPLAGGAVEQRKQ